jgi:hypothetical protein
MRGGEKLGGTHHFRGSCAQAIMDLAGMRARAHGMAWLGTPFPQAYTVAKRLHTTFSPVTRTCKHRGHSMSATMVVWMSCTD